MGNWASFNGWAIAHGGRPVELPLADFCDLAYYWLTHRLGSEDRAKLDAELLLPPAGTLQEEGALDNTAWSAEAEMAAFMAAQ